MRLNGHPLQDLYDGPVLIARRTSRPRSAQGAIVVTRLTKCGTWLLPRASVAFAPETEQVTTGLRRSASRRRWTTSRQTGMRHNPNARPTNNTLGAVYIRRAPRAFACTDNESARKLNINSYGPFSATLR